ncbi:hypothetical protein [Alkalihalobacterium elongatum]|uniref:hypothetical protein n=1 Tax=Alkalihalobacterium elongatum TaxID=2675466 RepID=UPI001C1FEE98|nr:hypothetical protein [Alkalihalobacterium elongatum]
MKKFLLGLGTAVLALGVLAACGETTDEETPVDDAGIEEPAEGAELELEEPADDAELELEEPADEDAEEEDEEA